MTITNDIQNGIILRLQFMIIYQIQKVPLSETKKSIDPLENSLDIPTKQYWERCKAEQK